MNQTPEEILRNKIYKALKESGWFLQKKNDINLFAVTGVAVREYLAETEPADYVLFVNKKLVIIQEVVVR